MRWFSGLFSVLGSFIAYYPKKKNWNPDWYIKWIGVWPSVPPRCSDLRIPPPFSVATPPPFIEQCPARLRKNGATQLDPSVVGCFPPPVPRAGYAPSTLLLFDTQRSSYTSVVIRNLFCDWNSDRQVSCCRNLRRFKQINNHDIYTTQ